ncbi:MAG: beta-N-acetylhexosaminidase [Bdellovibrio sp.]
MSELGQLVFTGISGTSLTDEEKKFIETENIGGVILFSQNYESPAQVAELVNSIQVLRKEYPLFIAVDQEGGRVQRFKAPFSIIPPMYDLSLINSPKIIYTVSKIIADELAAVGVNLNLAPVCDIWTNPSNKVIGDRAFGNDHSTVSKYVSSVIRGFQTNGIIACSKHFPGHGDTTKDSHYDLPIIKKSLDELRVNEFIPFIKAVKSRVEFMMMAHLQVDAIDPELPTTLSPHAYNLIRKELRFTKIIISDDMTMKAIADRWSYEEAAVMTIAAGADIVEYKDMDKAQLAVEALKEAKRNKKIKSETLKAKIDRINECKKNYFAEYRPVYIPEIRKKIGVRANQIMMEEIMEKIAQIKKQVLEPRP